MLTSASLSVFLCGVGGQGVMTAADLIAQAAVAHGLDCKKSEIAGISQRGGVVTSQVRFGPKVLSAVISPGTADLLLVSRFGGIMAVLVATALIGDLILLPALLAGPLGRVLTRQKSRAQAADMTAAADRSPSAVPAPHAWAGKRLAAAGRPAYTDR